MTTTSIIAAAEAAIDERIESKVNTASIEVERRVRSYTQQEIRGQVQRELARQHPLHGQDPRYQYEPEGLTNQAAFEISEKVREMLLHPSQYKGIATYGYRIPFTTRHGYLGQPFGEVTVQLRQPR